MDFVDLDKVLDEFEEEEKQALSIIPGQELKPSGYLEFLEKHQEQEWALINPSKFSSTSGYTLERRSAREPADVSYDDPYVSLPTFKFGCVASDELTSVPYKRYRSLPEGKQRKNLSAIVTSLTRISVNDDDVNTIYTTATKVNERKGIANFSERKGTIAYHPIEVQTDALSPASEKELMLSPFPKSDIIVDGHGDTSVSDELVFNRESQQSQSPASSGIDGPGKEIALQQVSDISNDVEADNQIQAATRNIGLEDDSNSLLQPNLYTLAGTYGTAVGVEFPFSGQLNAGPNSAVLFDPHSPVVSARDTDVDCPEIEPIVCFNDLVDEDFDDDEVNMYLNELQGQKITNTNTAETSVPVRPVSLASATTEEPRHNSHAVDPGEMNNPLKELNTSKMSHLNQEDGNIYASEFSSNNSSAHHSHDSGNVPVVSGDQSMSGVGCNVKNILTSDCSQNDSQALYNSLIAGKMEIEMILDDIRKAELVTSSISENVVSGHEEIDNVNSQEICLDNISEQIMCGRMEIEGILDEVILKQQNVLNPILPQSTDFNCSHLQSNNEYGADNTNSRPLEIPLTGNSSDSPSPVGSASGQSYEIDMSVHLMGAGARPKDSSAFKKNRSNPSFGISKLSSETPAEFKPKIASREENTFPKHTLDTNGLFSDMPVQGTKLLDTVSPNVLRLGFQDVNEEMTGSDDISSLLPEDRPVLHDFSEPSSQSPSSLENDQSLASTNGLDVCHTTGNQNVTHPVSLDLPERAEEDPGHAGSLDSDEKIEEGTGDGKPVLIVPDAQDNLGHVAPFWIPDTDALTCMICQTKFTMWKRRHHCRACGKVLCAVCCNQKAVLPYLDNKEARVCVECHIQLNLVPGTGTNLRYPNPNNPLEYCSKVPPNQQVSSPANPPVVMVPAGVLRSSGGQKRVSEPKQVMFSDGIRPGCDLANLDDHQRSSPSPASAKAAKKAQNQPVSPQAHKQRPDSQARNQSLIPEDDLPPLLVLQKDSDGCVEKEATSGLDTPAADFKSEEQPLVLYAVNRNLSVGVKVINLDCCMNRSCWCYVTLGMDTVGESEVVVLLEVTEQELAAPSLRPPRDMFLHLQAVYEEALKGNAIKDMGHFIFHHSNTRNTEDYGFLFLRPTFQCLNKIPLPEGPYVFGILIQKHEVPWARVFPLRLMLRLGAEYKYYPCPLISVKRRKPVFFEIGHTIINLLADFRSYQYMLPQIRGVTIHMENKKTVINLPRQQYDDIMKAVRNSNEHVMALGSSFSCVADSHLVCIQSEDGNYQTQSINIQDRPRLVTGASFVVFNGALKLSSGLRAKSSIVEDGLMVQVLPEALASIKAAIKKSSDYTIQCGLLDSATGEEVVELRWVDDDRNFNYRVKSYIDGASLEEAEMITIKPPADYNGDTLAIRWTRVFFIQGHNSPPQNSNSGNMNQLLEDIAHACCSALLKHLEELKKEDCVKLGLRVNLTRDSIGYEIGSKGKSLPVTLLNTLDTFLVPIIHLALQEGVITEFIFVIIE